MEQLVGKNVRWSYDSGETFLGTVQWVDNTLACLGNVSSHRLRRHGEPPLKNPYKHGDKVINTAYEKFSGFEILPSK